jgi:uncharacterized protein (TIGR00725 family)
MYQFCISGAAKGSSVEESKEVAELVGKLLAKKGQAILTGATIGLPNIVAMAYKQAGGTSSVGLSPAASKPEHVLKYRLPTIAYDSILYTGLHYVGRDSLLVTSSDAVISIGGRMGTLHEFTIAVESDVPIGFIDNNSGIESEIRKILQITEFKKEVFVTFNNNPEKLIDDLIEHLNKMHKKYKDLYF